LSGGHPLSYRGCVRHDPHVVAALLFLFHMGEGAIGHITERQVAEMLLIHLPSEFDKGQRIYQLRQDQKLDSSCPRNLLLAKIQDTSFGWYRPMQVRVDVGWKDLLYSSVNLSEEAPGTTIFQRDVVRYCSEGQRFELSTLLVNADKEWDCPMIEWVSRLYFGISRSKIYWNVKVWIDDIVRGIISKYGTCQLLFLPVRDRGHRPYVLCIAIIVLYVLTTLNDHTLGSQLCDIIACVLKEENIYLSKMNKRGIRQALCINKVCAFAAPFVKL